MKENISLREVLFICAFILVIGFSIAIIICGFGYAINIVSTGLIGTLSWPNILAISAATVLPVCTIPIVYRIVVKAKDKPFEWALTVLAVLSSVICEFCKELYPSESVFIGILTAGTIGLLFLFGGMIWVSDKFQLEKSTKLVLSIFIFIMPPVLVIFRYCESEKLSLQDAVGKMSLNLWVSIIMFVLIATIILLLGYNYKNKNQ